MRIKIFQLLVLASLALWPGVALAQRNPVAATARMEPPSVRSGEVARVIVDATIEAPYHIYSVVPLPDPAPLPTTLEIDGPVEVVGDAQESKPEVKFDKGFEKDTGIHGPQARFARDFRVTTAGPAGKQEITVKFRFQACDERGCLPPRTLSLPVGFSVEAGAPRAEYEAPQPPLSDPVSSPPGRQVPSRAPQSVADQSWGAFLAGAFVAGLITLLTPCVFPMIPVTLAFFTKQATEEGKGTTKQSSVVKLALLYSLGIVVTFTGIGILLAVFVGANAARDFAINPWVNLVFASLFVVFGLALLEIFELRLPGSVQGVVTGRRAGTWGVLGMGLTFVVSAFTCTAPIVGSLLVVAANAQGAAAFLKPVLGMAVFASALALPFLLLSLFPSLLARLPKSGTWMTTLKGVMGFLEVAAAIKFLSNTDIYWNWQLLTQPAFLALWALVLLAAAAWLLGVLNIGFNTPTGKPTLARATWAALFGALAMYCLWGTTGRPLHPSIAQFLPPPANSYGPLRSDAREGELTWLRSLDQAKAEAKATGKRIFLDMTGHTCTNCRFVEFQVMPKAVVKDKLSQLVRVQLYTDSGPNATAEEGERNAKYMEETFQDLTLPRYAVLDADGTVLGTTDFTTAKEADSFSKWLEPLVR